MIINRKNLKSARKHKGLTQAEVAKRLSITTNAYQAIELGTRGTSEDNWLKLFYLFDSKIPLHKLMEKDKPKNFGENDGSSKTD